MRDPLTCLTAILVGTTAAATGSPKSTLKIERGVETGFSPKPTTRALLGVRLNDLFDRQAAAATCGYLNGYAQTCAAGYGCVTNYADYAAGCCVATAIHSCTLFTSCVNYNGACDAACQSNPYIGKCMNALYPSCYAKIWNYAIQYTEWDCASFGGYVTLEENPALLSTTTFAGTPTTTNLIPGISQTTTVTVSPSSSPGGGNGNSNGINGNGNTQNDGNTYVYNNGKGAASGAIVDMMAAGLRLLLQLHTFLAMFHIGIWI